MSTINWYPGHMTKARRMIEEVLGDIDAVAELVDARVPLASKNPDIERIISKKPRILILNKSDLASPAETKKWTLYYKKKGYQVVALNSLRLNAEAFYSAVDEVTKEKAERDARRGIKKRTVKVMLLGIPNVGKSTLINSLSGEKRAKTEDRPGVTRGKQWIALKNGMLLLDMPGILWPKLDNQHAALNLALTGAIKNEVLDMEEIAIKFMGIMRKSYPTELCTRYKLEQPLPEDNRELLLLIGRKRGYIVSGGEVDIERTASTIIDEFRAGKIGRITLDKADIIPRIAADKIQTTDKDTDSVSSLPEPEMDNGESGGDESDAD